MKQVLGMLVPAVACSVSLSAYNLQKVYQVDDPLYRQIRTLLISSGVSEPSTSGPWSAAELLSMLEPLEEKGLGASSAALKKRITDQLVTGETLTGQEGFSIWSEPTVTTEMYLHTNPTSDMNDILSPYGYGEQEPFVSVPVEFWMHDTVYGVFDLNYQKRAYPSDDYSYDTLQTNIFLGSNSVENYFPFHALMSWGNEHEQLVIGRDRLAWGSGESGNFIIGPEADFEDFIHYTFFGKPFSYTCLFTQFDRVDGATGRVAPTRFGGISQIFISHRYEISPTPSVRFALTESSLFAADGLDIRMFSPLMFLHNYYNFDISSGGQGNNIMGFDLAVTVSPGYSLYAQAVVDQIQFSNEMLSGITEDTLPDAFGLMLGLRNEQVLSGGTLSTVVEGVYTSPYLYLNTRFGSEDEDYSDYDGIIANNTDSAHARFLGYAYGPDALVGLLGFDYRSSADHELSGRAVYMLHGANRLIPNHEIPELETGEEAFRAQSPTGSAETGVRLSLGGAYVVSPSLSLQAQAVWTGYWNYLNGTELDESHALQALSGSNWHDMRVTLGVSMTPSSVLLSP
ncbi:MAG: hypothetical protein K9M84_05765 [Spirochaetia bacterium]|nr:hypothetical protein [Spirochaetia bacterium]MCF7941095.1 hypothetical protein [Spirochaetia bacterium]